MSIELRINRRRVLLELAKRDWTQTQLADLVGLSKQALSQWLLGVYDNPRLAVKVARALGLPDEALFETEPPEGKRTA